MQNLSLVLVVVVLCTAFCQVFAINVDTCTQNSACDIAVGDSCDSAVFSSPDCVTGAYCSSTTKKCTAYPSSEGADCSESLSCVDGFYCVMATKKCAAELADGSACTSSSQCKNTCDTLTSNKCVSYKYSLVGEGDSCVKVADGNTIKYPLCEDGTFCDSQKCVKTARKGEDCTTKQCDDGLNCGTGKTCVAYYSVAAGGDCEDDDECVVGAKCDNSKCASITSSEKGCNTTNLCGTGFLSDESCYCTKYGGTARCLVNDRHYIPTGSKCQSEIDSLHSCLDSKKTCSSKYSAANCCLRYEFDLYTDAYRHEKGSIGGKEYAEKCDSLGCDASSGTAVMVSQLVVAGAALAAVLF